LLGLDITTNSPKYGSTEVVKNGEVTTDWREGNSTAVFSQNSNATEFYIKMNIPTNHTFGKPQAFVSPRFAGCAVQLSGNASKGGIVYYDTNLVLTMSQSQCNDTFNVSITIPLSPYKNLTFSFGKEFNAPKPKFQIWEIIAIVGGVLLLVVLLIGLVTWFIARKTQSTLDPWEAEGLIQAPEGAITNIN